MTRVSENSSFHAIGYSVGKTKSRLEDLQLKGSNLKRIQKPSDDPIGNVELLTSRSKLSDSAQYLRNANYAKTQLAVVENSIEELTDLMVKAKELAIGQASSFYAPEVRQGIAKEIEQIRNQSLSIGNRRFGNRFIFGGYKTLTRPFDQAGQYQGDKNTMTIEITRDFYVPINFNGSEVFLKQTNSAIKEFKDPTTPLKNDLKQEYFPELIPDEGDENLINRELASTSDQEMPTEVGSIFQDLQSLENALITNNPEIVQTILPKFDDHIDRLITFRTKVGSIMNSITQTEDSIEKNDLITNQYKSKIEDADVAELFTDLSRQKAVLDATYKSSAQMMNQSLLKFI
jgi:flagellar hook-associated protein 3 FlgL